MDSGVILNHPLVRNFWNHFLLCTGRPNSKNIEYQMLPFICTIVGSFLSKNFLLFYWNKLRGRCSYLSGVITSCVNQPDGSKFPYPGDCKKYYVCKDEKGIEKSCFLGSYFSIYTHKCTLPALSGCKMEDKRRKWLQNCWVVSKVKP